MSKIFQQQKLALLVSLVFLAILLVLDPLLNMQPKPQSNLKPLPSLPKKLFEQGLKKQSDNAVIDNILAIFAADENANDNHAKNKTNIMPSDQQQQQQGLLKQLYVGQKRYRLSAIISQKVSKKSTSNSYQAILNVLDAELNSSKSIYVSKGEKIGDYAITNLTNRSLYLQQDQRQIELRLFQPAEIK